MNIPTVHFIQELNYEGFYFENFAMRGFILNSGTEGFYFKFRDSHNA